MGSFQPVVQRRFALYEQLLPNHDRVAPPAPEARMLRSRRSYALTSACATVAALALLLHGCGQEPTEPPAAHGLPGYRLTIGAGSSSEIGRASCRERV